MKNIDYVFILLIGAALGIAVGGLVAILFFAQNI